MPHHHTTWHFSQNTQKWQLHVFNLNQAHVSTHTTIVLIWAWAIVITAISAAQKKHRITIHYSSAKNSKYSGTTTQQKQNWLHDSTQIKYVCYINSMNDTYDGCNQNSQPKIELPIARTHQNWPRTLNHQNWPGLQLGCNNWEMNLKSEHQDLSSWATERPH